MPGSRKSSPLFVWLVCGDTFEDVALRPARFLPQNKLRAVKKRDPPTAELDTLGFLFGNATEAKNDGIGV